MKYKSCYLSDLPKKFNSIKPESIELVKQNVVEGINNIFEVVDKNTNYEVVSVVPVPMTSNVFSWLVTLKEKEANKSSTNTTKPATKKTKTNTKKETKDVDSDIVDDLKDNG